MYTEVIAELEVSYTHVLLKYVIHLFILTNFS